MIEILPFSAFIAFATSAACLWLFGRVASDIGLVDCPGGRKTHDRPTPLVGGIAMFIAFAVSSLTLDVLLSSYGFLFAGALLLVVFGVLDDLRELSALQRFGVQIIAALLMTVWAEVRLEDFGYLLSAHWELCLGVLAIPVTLFSTVGVINALNMVDGLDGLAASLVLVTLSALAAVAWLGGDLKAIGILALLAAAVLAFLRFNLRPGRGALVFMGDAGSMFLGFVLAWFLIDFSQGENRLLEPANALWIFALPLLDTVSIMIRRMRRGQSPFRSDRQHLHHLLLAAGLSPKQTLTLMLLLALLAAAVGLAGQLFGVAAHWMFSGFMGLFVLHYWMMSRSWRTMRFLNRPLVLRSEPGR